MDKKEIFETGWSMRAVLFVDETCMYDDLLYSVYHNTVDIKLIPPKCSGDDWIVSVSRKKE